jgi:glycosyltransferase involved in cell wall biosynthesis
MDSSPESHPRQISVVVPVYNEERSIKPFLDRLEPVLEKIGSYEIIFALDPSPDHSEELIRNEAQRNPSIGLLVFTRRFGQPAATMAGILNARGDWVAVIDIDLQDPPELIAKMLAKAQSEGYAVVTAKRTTREGETTVKKIVSNFGYNIINSVSEVPIPRDTGDFRIMSRRVVEELRGLSEGHGFLRGLVSLVGFPQTQIEYEREARLIGQGNYNRYVGSLRIGLNGLFGFSRAPLQMMMWTGFLIAILSALGILLMISLKIAFGDEYPLGIPTITVLVLFMGGVQLAAVGVLGEYVGRIYDEVRRRPLYIVERSINVRLRDPRGPRSGTVSAL